MARLRLREEVWGSRLRPKVKGVARLGGQACGEGWASKWVGDEVPGGVERVMMRENMGATSGLEGSGEWGGACCRGAEPSRGVVARTGPTVAHAYLSSWASAAMCSTRSW